MPSIRDIEPLLRNVTNIGVCDVAGLAGVAELADWLLRLTGTVDEAVEVAAWLLRGVAMEGARETILLALVGSVHRWEPRPPPDTICDLIRAYPLTTSTSTDAPPVKRVHPLILLLETYTRLLRADRDLEADLDFPSPLVLAELRTRREEHVVATKTIERSMRFLGVQAFPVRICVALLDAYAEGRAFEHVDEIWRMLIDEGGRFLISENAAIIVSPAL